VSWVGPEFPFSITPASEPPRLFWSMHGPGRKVSLSWRPNLSAPEAYLVKMSTFFFLISRGTRGWLKKITGQRKHANKLCFPSDSPKPSISGRARITESPSGYRRSKLQQTPRRRGNRVRSVVHLFTACSLEENRLSACVSRRGSHLRVPWSTADGMKLMLYATSRFVDPGRRPPSAVLTSEGKCHVLAVRYAQQVTGDQSFKP
jgi:hypothetical protein